MVEDEKDMKSAPSRRGWGWLAVQALIFALILWAPPLMRLSLPAPLRWAGIALILVGGWFGTGGLLALRGTLSAFPEPREDGRLVRTGVFRHVRHPIYCGLVTASLGLALWRTSLTGLLFAPALFVFFDLKSRYEEKRLMERFPEYADYRREVGKRLIPWLY